MAQAEGLIRLLFAHALERIFIFLPHTKGRGACLADQRLTQADFDGLSDTVKRHFSKVRHQTEAQWLQEGRFGPAAARTLILALSPENIDRLETQPLEEILAELETLDDRYYAAVPSLSELAARYGDPENQQLFRLRDLHLKWQQQFLKDTFLPLYDMNDERHSFSVRT